MTAPSRLLRLAALVLVLASTAAAQNAPPGPWNQEVLGSTKLGTPRTVYVATPDGYQANTAQRYPVLLILDANDRAQFQLAVANVGFLADRGSIPPMIVVGVPNGSDRTHDLTPTPSGSTAARFGTAGGSSTFADFLVDDVMPMVRSRYRTVPATILVGHSFGGLFALEVAARRPGAFAGIVAISPALWWNDSSLVVAYADAIAKSPATQRLYATSGGLEPEINRTTQRFAARLDSLRPAKVAFAHHFYPDDDHGMTPAPSLVDGLRFILEPISLARLPVSKLDRSSDSAAVVRAVIESEQSYRDGARYFGLPEQLPEPVLNTAGYRVLTGLGKPELAAWVFQRNVALHPESINVYDSLGDAYLAKGDTAKAKASFQKSIDVAIRTKVVPQPETITKLNQLEQQEATRRK
jgi:predicted alpha/beta superfamily hydrolase